MSAYGRYSGRHTCVEQDKRGDSFSRYLCAGRALVQFVFSNKVIHFRLCADRLKKIAIRFRIAHVDLLVLLEENPALAKTSDSLPAFFQILLHFDLAL